MRSRNRAIRRQRDLKPAPPDKAAERPRSATSFTLALVAMITGLGSIWLVDPGQHLGVTGFFAYLPLLPCLAVVLVIAVAEWVVPRLRSPSPGALAVAALRPLDLQRVAVRLWGLAATLGLIAFGYWLFPEYNGSFYAPYWQFLRTIAPAGALVPLYFMWADRRLQDPEDEYLHFGYLVLGRWHSARWPLIRHHLLSWAVKAFFLPLMAVYLNDEIHSLHNIINLAPPGSWPGYDLFYHLSYAADLLFCVVGYSTSMRLFDSQIRSVEPSVAGWLVALICYQPFYSVIGKFYLQYDDNIFWDNWLQPWPSVRDAWGVLIIMLTCTYALCTVAFGLRFSNLTHRGIITAGPYRYSKHPAYLAKNLSWWLISVPFISDQGWGAALRNCCLLALLNLVYYARARTEERHLSRDPTYVAYALWMNEHGLLRGLGRLLPFLRYRAPLQF
ncbi:MAG: isoprenylcysteine carboxylmethyltransferase family protein [Steroidobacterales bacterium]